MPNAKDFQGGNEKFLVIGPTGSGKTSLFTTIPGRKFMYIFDPNALNTIKGQDIDYEVFVPDTMNMKVVSLSKGVGDRHLTPLEPKTYTEWEKDFEDKLSQCTLCRGKIVEESNDCDHRGFFDDYDVIGFDSVTTFCDLVMDRVLFLNGRFGKQPEQPDWSAQINTIKNVFRMLTSLGKILFVTAHKDLKQDEISKRIQFQIMLPGQLRSKLPLLFSEVWNCEADINAEQKAVYQIMTRPDRQNPIGRSTITTEQFVDVTIPEGADPTNYGIGKLLKERK